MFVYWRKLVFHVHKCVCLVCFPAPPEPRDPVGHHALPGQRGRGEGSEESPGQPQRPVRPAEIQKHCPQSHQVQTHLTSHQRVTRQRLNSSLCCDLSSVRIYTVYIYYYIVLFLKSLLFSSFLSFWKYCHSSWGNHEGTWLNKRLRGNYVVIFGYIIVVGFYFKHNDRLC